MSPRFRKAALAVRESIRIFCILFPALAFAAEEAELQGRIIRTLSAQNARGNERDFRRTNSGNIRFVLAEGAQGKVEKTKSLPSGSIALYIKILTDPHKDEHVWVYWDKEPSRRTLRLVDGNGRATEEPPRAERAIAKAETPAVVGFDALLAMAKPVELPRPAELPRPMNGIVQVRGPDVAQGSASTAGDRTVITNPPVVTEISRAPVTREVSRAPAITIITNTPVDAVTRNTPVNTELPRSTEISRTPFDNLLTNKCGPMGAACLSDDARPFLRPTRQSQSNDPEIQALARKIVQDAGAGDDPVKITRAIHDWVAANIPYDAQAYARYLENPSNLHGYEVDAKTVLARGSAGTICSGYSNLVTALSRAASVPAVTIDGVIKYRSDGDKLLQCGRPLTEQRSHAWNLVWLNGQWMPMDVTWDSDSYFKQGRPAGAAGVTHVYDLGGPSWTSGSPDHLQCGQTPVALGRLPSFSSVATNSDGAD